MAVIAGVVVAVRPVGDDPSTTSPAADSVPPGTELGGQGECPGGTELTRAAQPSGEVFRYVELRDPEQLCVVTGHSGVPTLSLQRSSDFSEPAITGSASASPIGLHHVVM